MSPLSSERIHSHAAEAKHITSRSKFGDSALNEMTTLRASSHGELQALTSLKSSASDSGLFKSFSHSTNNIGNRFESIEELKGISKPTHPPRRPVRAVRPVSALSASGSFLQINHLQGELVRKRKVGDVKKQI